MARGFVFGLISKVVCKTIVGTDAVVVDVINASKSTNAYKAVKAAQAKAKAEEVAAVAAAQKQK